MSSYNELAESYDEGRFWEYDDPAHRIPTLAHVLRLKEKDVLLDVGCGTGYYLDLLMQRTGCRGIGVDPSEPMLRIARRRNSGLDARVGFAEKLPVPNGVIDALLCHHAAHHFADVPQFLREGNRVLAYGGRIALITVSHKQMQCHPLYQYFPELLSIDVRRIPDVDVLSSWMSEIGFTQIEVQVVDRSSIQLSWDRVFDYITRKFMSPMRLLTEAHFEAGRFAFEERVRASGLAACPVESYSITNGVAEHLRSES